LKVMMPILTLVVFTPLVSSPIVFLLGRRMGKRVGWISFIPLIFAYILLVSSMPLIRESSLMEIYGWASELGLTFGLLGDGLSVPLLLMLMSVFAFSTLYSIHYMDRRIREIYGGENKTAHGLYYSLTLLYAAALAGVMLSTNLIEFYLFFELLLVASWGLVFAFSYGDKWRTSLIYFIWTHIGGVLLFIGIALIHWRLGSFEIADIPRMMSDPIAFWAGISLALGLLIKISAFGLHAWLPPTYVNAPSPVSAMVGSTSVGLSTYALARLMLPFKPVLLGISGWLELWALITILYAGVMALVQRDFKSLVAYLSMSQMNYCVLGVFTYNLYGVSGAVSYAISHGLAIGLLFLTSGSIFHQTGELEFRRLGGLASKMPSALIACLVGFLTIGGVPPTIGFESKFTLLTGAFQRGIASSPLEFSVALLATTLATVITLAYEFWTIWRLFYTKLPEGLMGVREAPLTMVVALLFLSLESLVMGIWPYTIAESIERVVHLSLATHSL